MEADLLHCNKDVALTAAAPEAEVKYAAARADSRGGGVGRLLDSAANAAEQDSGCAQLALAPGLFGLA